MRYKGPYRIGLWANTFWHMESHSASNLHGKIGFTLRDIRLISANLRKSRQVGLRL